jgi:hypothetical protein
VLLAPIGRLLPGDRREKLPTLLRPADDIGREIGRAGIPFVNMRRERLAALLWGEKPSNA